MNDEYFMQQALKEAQKAFEEGEVPVGAVIVMNERIIARAHNQVEKLNDATAHAEIIALTSAFNFLGSKYVDEATMYITVEPCLMCAGAMYWSKVKRIVYGAPDEKNGYKQAMQHNGNTGAPWPFHQKAILEYGILKDDCAALMKDFFRNKR